MCNQIMNMKKIISIFCFLLFITNNSFGQIKFCAYFDGFWSPWVSSSEARVYGNYESFVVHTVDDGPWNYRFKFTINDFKVPNKKQRKKDLKANKYYEFSGTVEYYTSYDFPSARDAFRQNKGPKFISANMEKGKPTKKITSKATIRVRPFKDYPRVYNIWYDNVALGIDLNTTYFTHKVEYK